jgi:hypothetical protein
MAATEKISVTIGRVELAHAKRLADHLGLSLSGFISDAVRERIQEQARREAASEVLATFAPEERASQDEARALLERWAPGAAPAAARKAKPKPKAKARPVRARKSR